MIFSALFTILFLLPIVGLTLSNAYQQHMESAVENEMNAYVYALLTVAEFEDGELIMPEVLTVNQFNISQSGLYAMISSTGAPLQTKWQSASLLTVSLPKTFVYPKVGENVFYQQNIEDSAHFIYSYSVSFNDSAGDHPVTLHIIKSKSGFSELMTEFRQQLWFGLFVLMAVLIVLQLIWLRWSLKPLSNLGQEIAEIEQGQRAQLDGKYPAELSQVTEQLNILLTTEQKQRTRYRNALSDLAHSLKTPLAVLQGQIASHKLTESQEPIDTINLMIEHQLKRAQSAGQHAWYLGVKIAPTLEKLLNSLQKIYRDKAIQFSVECPENIVFKGDETDLLEMLGNLLDNASKACKDVVKCSVYLENNTLFVRIEDNGKGIAPDKIHEILNRGTRADNYQHGHGIGLAIVRDLVESYQGELTIDNSPSLNGARFTLSFTR